MLKASFATKSMAGTLTPLHLTEGHTYRLSLEERSDAAQSDGYLWPAIDNNWDMSIGIWQPYDHDWQTYSKTFVASKTGDFAFYLNVYLNVEKPGTGTYSLRNLRLDDLTLGTAGTGGGQINEPSLATLESLGYATLEDGVATVDSTDTNVEMDSIHTVNLIGGHTYLVSYEKRGSTLSVRLKQQFADPVGSGQKDDWYKVKGGITVAGEGVKVFNIALFVARNSHTQVRNFYMQDVAYTDGGGVGE